MEDGPDSAYVEEESACPRKVQGHHTTKPSTETVSDGFMRTDQDKSRR